MKQFQRGIRGAENVRSVLHIGAGYGDALEDYRGSGAVTLVEPNPEMVAELRSRTAQFAHATVIPVAAGSKAKRVTLNIYNLPELSSLRTATGIMDLLPGLHVVDRPKIEMLPLSEILALHETDDEGPNLLVIDAPGEEASLLETAVSRGMIDRFQHLTVYCGLTPLFEGSSDADHVTALLDPLFFDLHDAAPDDWGRLRLHFRRNAARMACRSLETERDDLRRQLAKRDREVAVQKEKLSAQAETLEKQRLQLEEAQHHLTTANAQKGLWQQELLKLEAQMELIRDLMTLSARADND